MFIEKLVSAPGFRFVSALILPMHSVLPKVVVTNVSEPAGSITSTVFVMVSIWFERWSAPSGSVRPSGRIPKVTTSPLNPLRASEGLWNVSLISLPLPLVVTA